MMAIDLARFNKSVSLQSLAVFRICFGLLLCFSCLRYIHYGWIDTQLLAPTYHFTYLGFDWVRPLSRPVMYGLFGTLATLGLCISAGVFYRTSCALFFVGFTYIELIDKTYYLNHYYFVSLICVLLFIVPTHHMWSVYAWRRQKRDRPTPTHIPAWMLYLIRGQVGIVYFYAGLAKLNTDWLVHAQPLKIWLGAKGHLPIIGTLLTHPWTPYIASWSGCVFDLLIVPALLIPKTRRVAYIAVIIFHISTWMLFPIGIFPWVMMVSATVFFSPTWLTKSPQALKPTHQRPHLGVLFLCIWMTIQVLFPWRYLLYPGDVKWHEQGFRFGWRVMLVEKSGMAEFRVKRGDTQWTVYPRQWLTPLQLRMMSTQPDMILQFAHHLANHYKTPNQPHVEVYADVWVAAQGRPSQRLVDPKIDLTRQPLGWRVKSWIIPRR